MASSARRLRAGIGLPRGQRFRARHRCVPDDPGGRQRRRQYGDPHRQCGIGGGTRHHRAGPVLSVTDLTASLPSYQRIQGGFPLVAESMRWFRKHYVPAGTPFDLPRLSPLLHAEGRRQPLDVHCHGGAGSAVRRRHCLRVMRGSRGEHGRASPSTRASSRHHHRGPHDPGSEIPAGSRCILCPAACRNRRLRGLTRRSPRGPAHSTVATDRVVETPDSNCPSTA